MSPQELRDGIYWLSEKLYSGAAPEGEAGFQSLRALGIQALEMIAPLTPGAPLCRAYAPGSSVGECEVVFKGGQVGVENYFQTVLKGKP